MSHYKRNAASNRDALFGSGPPSSSGGGGASKAKPSSSGANRQRQPARSTSSGSSGGSSRPATGASASSSRPASASASSASASASGGYTSTNPRLRAPARRSGSGQVTTVLSGAAKMAKMKEAEEYRTKAKKAMTRGVFSGADPIAASNYYKRAAEAYKLCGENRLERLHRIASGDCQMGQDAYATAAAEYMRAAELAAASDEPNDRKRAEVHKLYNDAANAWRQQGEAGRAGDCTMNAAFGLLIGTGDDDDDAVQTFEGERKGSILSMNKKALKAIEEAVEAHVPDILNRYGSFRQVGESAYVDPNADPNDVNAKYAAFDLAKTNMVTTSYAHETVYKACYKLIRYGEYPSALYAAGAATAIIEADGFATISLARAFAAETVLTLALGDVVAAEKNFLEVHLQKNSYLKSRECKLAEDLVRAIKSMDDDALEEARSPAGSNRAALANLDPNIRSLVVNLRVSGRAGRGSGSGPAKAQPRKNAPPKVAAAKGASAPRGPGPADPSALPAARKVAPAPPAAGPAKEEKMLEGEELQASLDANFAELDDLMGDIMGLAESDGDAEGGEETGGSEQAAAAAAVEEEDDDDLDVDLR